MILHISKLFSPISPWNKHMDNFIESILVFVDKLLFDRRAIIIMHVDDLHALKKIRSFLENY
jgi:hypothetical protein